MNSNTEEKTTLIYIASNGRSGSTLLELMLNTLEETWTLGELATLKWELKENQQKCGCGKKISDCNFWQSVSNEMNKKEIENLSPFRGSHGSRKLLRKHTYPLLKNKEPSGNHKNFCNSVDKLLDLIKKEVSKKKITHFIDA
ncbi:MAG: hypothetical protein ABEI53_03400, partial [Candidatus Magasanikbacteria bacterium]